MQNRFSRRSFLKLAGAFLPALALPRQGVHQQRQTAQWPELRMDRLPQWVQAVLRQSPTLAINSGGYLEYFSPGQAEGQQVILAQTQWNQETSIPQNVLSSERSWGIVLHWYGDGDSFDRSLAGYLRGFDELRDVGGYITRTSAHFLVGWGVVEANSARPSLPLGIVQTQAPDENGVPYAASHLMIPLDYAAHREKKQYFVRALYELGYRQPAGRSILQDFFDGPPGDPNLQTLAIEIAGHDFDQPAYFPPDQQIANLLSLLAALMKRYGVTANNLLGHHEVDLRKGDPGKRFMTVMRYLLGVKALLDKDAALCACVFGPFWAEGMPLTAAAQAYFQWVRAYLVLVGLPFQVYLWEAATGFWSIADQLSAAPVAFPVAECFDWPCASAQNAADGGLAASPGQAGIDLYPAALQEGGTEVQAEVFLAANGLCLLAGRGLLYQSGYSAVFRHRQPDAAEVLTIYSHLDELGEIRESQFYAAGAPVGKLLKPAYHGQRAYLHFAIAYGAAWETDLHTLAQLPLNATADWIQPRFLDPQAYLAGHGPTVQPPARRFKKAQRE